MTENENLSDLYYERLSSTTNPGTVLARFMGELIDRPINKSHIIMMNKMVKNYGRFLVFFSILDLSDVRDLGENIYPLMSAICKRRFEKAHVSSVIVQYNKLDREITKLDEEAAKVRKSKIKFPSSDDLGKASNE